MSECVHCGAQVWNDSGALVDNSGGDVCGSDGSNSPHQIVPSPFGETLPDMYLDDVATEDDCGWRMIGNDHAEAVRLGEAHKEAWRLHEEGKI